MGLNINIDRYGDSIVGMVKRVVVGGDVGRKSDVIGMRIVELMPESEDFDPDQDV
jgi:hypothetical protein